MPACDLFNGDDIISVEDLTNRVDEVVGTVDNTFEHEFLKANLSDGEREELSELMKVLNQLKGAGGDWEWRGDWYPAYMYKESHFEDYAREFAADVVDGFSEAWQEWPFNHIDWKAAAEELRQDYSEIDVLGVTYYAR